MSALKSNTSVKLKKEGQLVSVKKNFEKVSKAIYNLHSGQQEIHNQMQKLEKHRQMLQYAFNTVQDHQVKINFWNKLFHLGNNLTSSSLPLIDNKKNEQPQKKSSGLPQIDNKKNEQPASNEKKRSYSSVAANKIVEDKTKRKQQHLAVVDKKTESQTSIRNKRGLSLIDNKENEQLPPNKKKRSDLPVAVIKDVEDKTKRKQRLPLIDNKKNEQPPLKNKKSSDSSVAANKIVEDKTKRKQQHSAVFNKKTEWQTSVRKKPVDVDLLMQNLQHLKPNSSRCFVWEFKVGGVVYSTDNDNNNEMLTRFWKSLIEGGQCKRIFGEYICLSCCPEIALCVTLKMIHRKQFLVQMFALKCSPIIPSAAVKLRVTVDIVSYNIDACRYVHKFVIKQFYPEMAKPNTFLISIRNKLGERKLRPPRITFTFKKISC